MKPLGGCDGKQQQQPTTTTTKYCRDGRAREIDIFISEFIHAIGSQRK